MYYDVNIRCFVNCVRDLLDSPEVQSMRALPHHPGTSCYEHSVFVAYVSFRLARRWGLDYRAAARAGLLHDLYLYDARNKPAYYGNQCFAHPPGILQTIADRCQRAVVCGRLFLQIIQQLFALCVFGFQSR